MRGLSTSQLARLTSWRAVICGCGVMGCVFVLEVSCRRFLGKLYTSDEAVLSLIAVSLPVAACMHFFDGLQTVLSGVMRACALQAYAAAGNLFGY